MSLTIEARKAHLENLPLLVAARANTLERHRCSVFLTQFYWFVARFPGFYEEFGWSRKLMGHSVKVIRRCQAFARFNESLEKKFHVPSWRRMARDWGVSDTELDGVLPCSALVRLDDHIRMALCRTPSMAVATIVSVELLVREIVPEITRAVAADRGAEPDWLRRHAGGDGQFDIHLSQALGVLALLEPDEMARDAIMTEVREMTIPIFADAITQAY